MSDPFASRPASRASAGSQASGHTADCDLLRCFQGIIPAIMATCSKDGTPNVTYLSHVYYVDEKHVALSRQFLNKTSDNVAENPYAAVQVLDPVGFMAYSLDLRFDHAETSGPLFETMAMRIQAIATHTGMAGVFKLIAADVYEVLKLEPVPGFVLPEGPEDDAALAVAGPPSFRGELRALQVVSAHLGRKADLEDLLSTLLATLDAEMGFEHAMVLLVDESGERLYTIASRGYGDAGIGAEVALGDGLIGTVAERRRVLSLTDVDGDMRYGRAIRAEVRASGASHALRAVIPLPGLPDARSQLAIPLESCGRLVGVLAVESRDPAGFASWHESFLSIVGNQAAVAIDAAMLRELDGDEPPPRRAAAAAVASVPEKRARTFVFYRNDDCVFVDDEYLIRNVPGKILWKILRGYANEGRIDYTNRELRLDPWLGLPVNKDNLESRLILLRKRLEQKCPDLRMTPKKRGQFRLEVDCRITLIEKHSG